jgi:hypothetical protein
MEEVGRRYMAELEGLIDHCLERVGRGEQERTPSDYGLGKEVGYEELDVFLRGKKNKEDKIIGF